MRYFPFIRSIAGLIQGHTIVENSDAAFWSENRVTKITGWPGHIPELLAQQWEGFKVSQLEIFGGDISEDELSDLFSVFDEIEVTFDTASTGKIWSGWHRPAHIRGDTPSDQFFGATVEVLNDQGFEVEAGKVGILRVKTDVSAPLSVIHRAEGNNPVQGDWIYPGLIGQQNAENGIVILGHALDDVLSIQEQAIFGPEIDTFLKSISGIVDAVAFENPKSERDEILAFAIFQKGVNPYQKAELAKLETSEKLGEVFAPSIIRAVNAIPGTKEGFPDREACGLMIMMAAHREKSE